MTPQEMAILDEQALADWRVVEEAQAHCELRATKVLHRIERGVFDDNETVWLQCTEAKCSCSKYWVATDFVNGRVDIREMTTEEIKRYARN